MPQRAPTCPQAARDYLRFIAELRSACRSRSSASGPGASRSSGRDDAGYSDLLPLRRLQQPQPAAHRPLSISIAVSVICTLTMPALGPVDVVELEQQRRLVERQRDARAERQRQPRRRALVARRDRRRRRRGTP